MSPLEVIALEAVMFCPVSYLGEHYNPEFCKAHGCTVCADLLIHNGGMA